MSKISRGAKDNRSSNRYWSLMIVGEHGQVISMQRVKPLIWGAGICLVAAILAAAVAIYLYLDQKQKAGRLAKQLQEMEYKLDAMKEQKDILMAKLVIARQQNRSLLEQGPAGKQADGKDDRIGKNAPRPGKPGSAGSPEQSAAGAGDSARAGKDPGLEVKPAVDIQRFQVTYDPVDQVLKASFRIINVSRPKVSVSGRAVVVFKATGSPPIKWRASPMVKLVDGEPDGKRGKSFRINNFKRMTFLAYRVSLPVAYDTASVYVFDRRGKILLQREFEFSLPREPEPPEVDKPSGSRTESRLQPPVGQRAGEKNVSTRLPDSKNTPGRGEQNRATRPDKQKSKTSLPVPSSVQDDSAPGQSGSDATSDRTRDPAASKEKASTSRPEDGNSADSKPGE